MNPFKITLLTLAAWIIVTIITLFSIPGGEAFATMFGSFYLAPVICLIAFVVGSALYFPWVKKNKNAFTVSWILLIIWLLAVAVIFFTRCIIFTKTQAFSGLRLSYLKCVGDETKKNVLALLAACLAGAGYAQEKQAYIPHGDGKGKGDGMHMYYTIAGFGQFSPEY